MNNPPRTLLLGGTGQTGRFLASMLITNHHPVRALVRSKKEFLARIPDPEIRKQHSGDTDMLQVIETKVPSFSQVSVEEWQKLLQGCENVTSCIGHPVSLLNTITSSSLVTPVVRNIVEAASKENKSKNGEKTRLILLSCDSVVDLTRAEERHGIFRRTWRAFTHVPYLYHRDNVTAAAYLQQEVGRDHPAVEWCVVRASRLRHHNLMHEPKVGALVAAPSPLNSPGQLSRVNCAGYLTKLVVDREHEWRKWRGKCPVVMNGHLSKIRVGTDMGIQQG